MPEHTVKAHASALDQLTSEVTRMGELTVSQIGDAVLSASRSDIALAQVVVNQDAGLDALEAEIEHDAIRLIALRQPMAQDLRHTVAAMKIANNLERCGDLAKNVAKRVILIAETDASMTADPALERIGGLAAERLREVLAAYRDRDLQRAMAVWQTDREIDDLHDAFWRDFTAKLQSNPAHIAAGSHWLFVAKNLERIGDHATNIAELVVYELTGEPLRDTERPRSGV